MVKIKGDEYNGMEEGSDDGRQGKAPAF